MKLNHKIKAVFCLVLTVAIMFTCSSCFLLYDFLFYRYTGEHPDLYTVALSNVFGISGYTNNGEVSYNPEISIIETDDYGRTLFFYNESYYDGNNYGMAFLIMQKSEDGYVYYYQDDCCIPFFDDSEVYDYHGREDSEDYIRAVSLSKEIIEALKEQNDWNKEFNQDKCTKTKIIKKQSDGEIDVNDWDFDEAIYTYAKDHGYEGTDDKMCRLFRYCNTDTEGKELYYVFCMTNDKKNGEDIYGKYVYAVIVNPDETISQNAIVEIKEPSTSYKLVKELKKNNNWKY